MGNKFVSKPVLLIPALYCLIYIIFENKQLTESICVCVCVLESKENIQINMGHHSDPSGGGERREQERNGKNEND